MSELEMKKELACFRVRDALRTAIRVLREEEHVNEVALREWEQWLKDFNHLILGME